MEEEQVFEVLTLADPWEEIFSAHEEDFLRTDAVKHCITTGSPQKGTLLQKEMRSLLVGILQGGIIAESFSP